jgi:hypothetical protein
MAKGTFVLNCPEGMRKTRRKRPGDICYDMREVKLSRPDVLPRAVLFCLWRSSSVIFPARPGRPSPFREEDDWFDRWFSCSESMPERLFRAVAWLEQCADMNAIDGRRLRWGTPGLHADCGCHKSGGREQPCQPDYPLAARKRLAEETGAPLECIAHAYVSAAARGICWVNGNRVVCGARCRDGHACKRLAALGKKRCANHGGLSTGPKSKRATE